VIVGVIRRKPVLTHASIVCEGMLASVNSVNSVSPRPDYERWPLCGMRISCCRFLALSRKRVAVDVNKMFLFFTCNENVVIFLLKLNIQ